MISEVTISHNFLRRNQTPQAKSINNQLKSKNYNVTVTDLQILTVSENDEFQMSKQTKSEFKSPG